jgi:hypothetical protein
MAAERKPIEIDGNPELLRLVEEMEASGRPRTLRRAGKDVAIVSPTPARKRRARTKMPKPTTAESALWTLVGISDQYENELDPDRPTDVSSNKHKYLADAYADLHDDE